MSPTDWPLPTWGTEFPKCFLSIFATPDIFQPSGPESKSASSSAAPLLCSWYTVKLSSCSQAHAAWPRHSKRWNMDKSCLSKLLDRLVRLSVVGNRNRKKRLLDIKNCWAIKSDRFIYRWLLFEQCFPSFSRRVKSEEVCLLFLIELSCKKKTQTKIFPFSKYCFL